MLELKDGMNFQDFMLSLKPDSWFRRHNDESVSEWLERVSVKESMFLEKAKWREDNRYWLDVSFDISLAVLSFLRQNNMEKETLEQLVGFELYLNGSHDWTISELKKLELYTNIKVLCN